MADKEPSVEEIMFQAWLQEAEATGLVSSWEEQIPFDLVAKASVPVLKQMKTKVKVVHRHLFHPHTYTADFRFTLTSLGTVCLQQVFELALLTEAYRKTGDVYVDTKGGFTVQHGQAQMFSANQKLMFYFHQINVVKVVPWVSKGPCLFRQSWCPEQFRWMKNRKKPTLTVKGEQCASVQEFIDGFPVQLQLPGEGT